MQKLPKKKKTFNVKITEAMDERLNLLISRVSVTWVEVKRSHVLRKLVEKIVEDYKNDTGHN